MGLEIYEKEKEIPIFKIGDCEGIVKVYLSLEAGVWTYVNALVVGKIRQQYEEEEHNVELGRKDLSVEIKDQDSLTKFREELDEAIKNMKNVLYDHEDKMIKGKEFIDSYMGEGA